MLCFKKNIVFEGLSGGAKPLVAHGLYRIVINCVFHVQIKFVRATLRFFNYKARGNMIALFAKPSLPWNCRALIITLMIMSTIIAHLKLLNSLNRLNTII